VRIKGECKMNYPRFTKWILLVLVSVAAFAISTPAYAQIRPLYPPGFSATNSGVLPAPGLTYLNYFDFFSFDELKGPNGGTLPVNIDAKLFIDMNTFIYMTKYKILGGSLGFIAILPLQNAALALSDQPIGISAGFGESFYQPFLLGWKKDRYEINTGYAFLLDTGPAGVGYGANALTLGDTFYLTKNKAISVSSYQIYEFHTRKDATQTTPGQALTIDYSAVMTLPLQKDFKSLMQFGLAGYIQRQTSDNSGPGATPIIRSLRYKDNALGFAVNFLLPPKGVVLGLKYLHEFSNQSTVEGQSLQISGSVTF